MPRRIVIHAGFHKTGTSSVQRALRNNRSLLKPYLRSVLKPGMKDLLHAARGYSTWRDPVSLDKVRLRFGTLLEGVGPMPRRTLCLSAEELSGHLPGRDGIKDFEAAVDLAREFVSEARLRVPGTEISLIYTTRQPETWLESAYWEHVKSSSMTLDFDTFAETNKKAADLGGIVDRIASALPCPVHRAALEDHRENPAAPVLKLCGVPWAVIADLPTRQASNARLPKPVLLDLLAANRAYADRDARKAAKQAILKAASKEGSK